MRVVGSAALETGGRSLRLPGDRREDRVLLDRVVAQVNRIHDDRHREFVRQVGTFLLNAFFRNSSSAYEQSAHGHVSYRALAKRSDLEVSATTLYHAVAIEVQIRNMPLDLANGLTMTHHRVLLPVKDMELKLRLAHEAITEHWSTRELQERVHHELRRRGRKVGGRRALAPWERSLKRLNKALGTLRIPEDFDEVKPEVVDPLLAVLDERLARLEAYREALVARRSG